MSRVSLRSPQRTFPRSGRNHVSLFLSLFLSVLGINAILMTVIMLPRELADNRLRNVPRFLRRDSAQAAAALGEVENRNEVKDRAESWEEEMKSEPARRDLENARGHSLSDGKPGAFARGARERSCLTSHLACASQRGQRRAMVSRC